MADEASDVWSSNYSKTSLTLDNPVMSAVVQLDFFVNFIATTVRH